MTLEKILSPSLCTIAKDETVDRGEVGVRETSEGVADAENPVATTVIQVLLLIPGVRWRIAIRRHRQGRDRFLEGGDPRYPLQS